MKASSPPAEAPMPTIGNGAMVRRGLVSSTKNSGVVSAWSQISGSALTFRLRTPFPSTAPRVPSVAPTRTTTRWAKHRQTSTGADLGREQSPHSVQRERLVAPTAELQADWPRRHGALLAFPVTSMPWGSDYIRTRPNVVGYPTYDGQRDWRGEWHRPTSSDEDFAPPSGVRIDGVLLDTGRRTRRVLIVPGRSDRTRI